MKLHECSCYTTMSSSNNIKITCLQQADHLHSLGIRYAEEGDAQQPCAEGVVGWETRAEMSPPCQRVPLTAGESSRRQCILSSSMYCYSVEYQTASTRLPPKADPTGRGRSSGRAATAERAGVLHLLSIFSLLYFYSTSTFPVLLPTTYEAEPSRK